MRKQKRHADIPRSELAYRLYLQANQLARHPQTWVAARALYRDSTVADERFAPAWAGLGRLERVLPKYQVDGADVMQGYAAAEAALRRALELSPTLPQAHYHYAQLEADTGRTEEALGRLLRRLHVRQTDPEIYAGLVLVCRYCGLLEASVAAHQSAVALDPAIKTSIALTRLAQFEFEAALAATDDSDTDIRILALEALNRHGEALELARQPTPRISDYDNAVPMRRALRAYLEGRVGDAVADLHLASGVNPERDDTLPRFPDGEDVFWVSGLYARLGRTDLGLLGFRAAVEQGYFSVAHFERESWLDPIRHDPKFIESMELARTRYQSALRIFIEQGGPRRLGVNASTM